MKPAAEPDTAEPDEEVAHDSPRASVEAFLDAGRAGEWDRASRYLALPDDRKDEGAVLAGFYYLGSQANSPVVGARDLLEEFESKPESFSRRFSTAAVR